MSTKCTFCAAAGAASTVTIREQDPVTLLYKDRTVPICHKCSSNIREGLGTSVGVTVKRTDYKCEDCGNPVFSSACIHVGTQA